MVHQRLIRTKRGIRVDIGSLPPGYQYHPANGASEREDIAEVIWSRRRKDMNKDVQES
jgi:hypothetical protein